MTKVLSLSLVMLFSLQIMAAPNDISDVNFYHKDYDWESEPILHELSEEEQEESAVIINETHIFEYAYNNDDGLYLFETEHQIVKVNDDQAVESFNKVFVPMNGVIDFINLKARAISPDGEIKILNENNIKEIENVEDYGNFKIFAIEGAVKGGEIEYLYTTQSKVYDPYGRQTLQGDTKIKEVNVTVISPSNLIFEAQGYNGIGRFSVEDDNEKQVRILRTTVNDIPRLIEEDYCTYRANLMKIDYRLTKNVASYFDKQMENELYGWNMAAESFSDIIYSYNENSEKIIANILKKDIKLKKLKTNRDKAAAIEAWVKDNISIEYSAGSDLNDVEKILENRYAGEVGISKLMGAFFTVAEIPHRLVVTSDRFNSRFDPDFASWNNFTDVLFYIPDANAYVSAPLIQFRLGLPPYQFAGNYGLFIDNQTEAFDVKYIDFPEAEVSTNNINAEVNFNKKFDVTVNIKHGWTGYRGAEFRTLYKYQDMDFMRGRVKSGMEQATIEEIEIFNDNMRLSANPENEFYVQSQLKDNSLVEKAGKSYLFNIGNIIGGQVELYQEQERQHPIDMPYPTYYKRKIEFTIPEGYKAEGLEDLKIDKQVVKDGKIVNRFISDYTVKDNKVVVTADEFYKTISLPKEDYEQFREVINAAADFNKVVVVFEKK